MADLSWPMARHDPQRTGRTEVLGPRQEPRVLWKRRAGSFQFFVGLDGAAYVGADDRCIYAVNADGNIRWAYQAEERVAVEDLAVDGIGNIFSGGASGPNDFLLALDANGVKRWTFYLGTRRSR